MTTRRLFPRPTAEDLRSAYWTEGLTYPQMAERYGVSEISIGNWLRKFDIPKKHGKRFEDYVQIAEGGCHEWIGAVGKGNGYGVFRSRLAHRVAYEQTNGPIPAGMYVCHTCDNRRCVNPEHLWLGTHSDNMRDMADKGRNFVPMTDANLRARRRGAGNPAAKLTDGQAREIKRLRGIVPTRELAQRFGVSPTTICDIHKERCWTHV